MSTEDTKTMNVSDFYPEYTKITKITNTKNMIHISLKSTTRNQACPLCN